MEYCHMVRPSFAALANCLAACSELSVATSWYEPFPEVLLWRRIVQSPETRGTHRGIGSHECQREGFTIGWFIVLCRHFPPAIKFPVQKRAGLFECGALGIRMPEPPQELDLLRGCKLLFPPTVDAFNNLRR